MNCRNALLIVAASLTDKRPRVRVRVRVKDRKDEKKKKEEGGE